MHDVSGPGISEAVLWAIILAPLAAFTAITLYVRHLPKIAGYLSIAAIAASLVLSLIVLVDVLGADGHSAIYSHEWFQAGPLDLTLGVRVDGLTAVMLVVVTSVAFLVQVYSQGYMEGDPGYGRYYAYMSLFITAMLGLVLADNLFMLFIFWELVGLSSYLLIGFWFHKPSAAAAAKKAFIVTRIGDLGLLAAILLIWTRHETFAIHEIHELAIAGALGGTTITLFGLGLFAGAVGKSAQFPLHVWLPDAMEGPTPVSALIHAATMVAAGVYLMARFFPVLEAAPDAREVVGWIGAATVVVGASLALVQTDLKRVLAYSTISQLGYMMLALGVFGYGVAVFHLFTHAFFKALLFLGSGSVNHATNTFDMRRMGGLRTVMPITFWTFLIGTLSLAGVFPLAGFWSKDEILLEAWLNNRALYTVAAVASFVTALYMFRAVFMTFFGEYKGGEPVDHEDEDSHFHGDPARPARVELGDDRAPADPGRGSRRRGLVGLGQGVPALRRGSRARGRAPPRARFQLRDRHHVLDNRGCGNRDGLGDLPPAPRRLRGDSPDRLPARRGPGAKVLPGRPLRTRLRYQRLPARLEPAGGEVRHARRGRRRERCRLGGYAVEPSAAPRPDGPGAALRRGHRRRRLHHRHHRRELVGGLECC